MGMFDDIRCRKPLPDGCTEEWFQTKDLGCDLSKFEIDGDGRLMRFGEGFWGEEPLTEPEDMEHHGYLNFYTSDSAGIWHEYDAKFTDGKLVEIKLHNA